MVDPVGKPHPFGIDHKLFPLGIVAVALVAFDNGVEGSADGQVVLVVLVCDDIPAAEGGFAQVIDQFFLVQGKFLESRDLIAHDPKVRELVDLPLEFLGSGFGRFFCFFTAHNQDGHDKSQCQNEQFF